MSEQSTSNFQTPEVYQCDTTTYTCAPTTGPYGYSSLSQCQKNCQKPDNAKCKQLIDSTSCAADSYACSNVLNDNMYGVCMNYQGFAECCGLEGKKSGKCSQVDQCYAS